MNQIFRMLQARYNELKAAKIKVGSLLFLEIVIAVSFIPVVVTIGMLIAVTVFHYTDGWPFQVIDYGIRVIDHIWSAQLVAGVLAYAAKLNDTNNNGIPDVDEVERR